MGWQLISPTQRVMNFDFNMDSWLCSSKLENKTVYFVETKRMSFSFYKMIVFLIYIISRHQWVSNLVHLDSDSFEIGKKRKKKYPVITTYQSNSNLLKCIEAKIYLIWRSLLMKTCKKVTQNYFFSFQSIETRRFNLRTQSNLTPLFRPVPFFLSTEVCISSPKLSTRPCHSMLLPMKSFPQPVWMMT